MSFNLFEIKEINLNKQIDIKQEQLSTHKVFIKDGIIYISDIKD